MANGTIAFDTLSTSGQITGTAKSVDTDFVVNGSAKMFNAARYSGGTPSATKSLNVSSMTDSNTGDSLTNLSSAMNDTNSATNVSNNTSANRRGVFSLPSTTSAVRHVAANSSDASVDDDFTLVLFGDLA